ncbi:MAG: histidine--tRNA ligase [Deltaproteobacteria bacterium]|nr:histidine--tRNA ligase [Deltaproteobacteria bacterium]
MTSTIKKIFGVRGVEDIFPPEAVLWQQVEATARRIFNLYGYGEIRTPIIEPYELFARGVGEGSAVVEKQMYTFPDRDNVMLALRPEGTAPVVRAYIESGTYATEALARYYYVGPMFRYERPQKGRQRQFHQIGVELFGTESPAADAEVITMAGHLFSALGIAGVTLEINSIGCPTCRPPFEKKLIAFLREKASTLCADCQRRLERNPLRVFDCKEASCQRTLAEAPEISAAWCEGCRDHFGRVRTALDQSKTSYTVNSRIVRGLDYYQRTAFEFTTDHLGAQNAVAAGGRYDGLVASLGGPDVPGVGFAIGLERLMLLCSQEAERVASDTLYVAMLSDSAVATMIPVISVLRKDGVRVEWDYEPKSLKSQMRRADKIGAHSVIIVGDDEVAKGEVVVRNMKTKEQHNVPLAALPRHFISVV